MLKELKYFFFIIIITIILFLTLKYYFSDENIKNSYRSLNNNEQRILKYSQKLSTLESDTDNNVEYLKKLNNKDKKNYNFWKLIKDNE